MILALDVMAMLTAAAAAWFWFAASRSHLRRVTRDEVLDAADFNRIIVSFNRAQHLNSRAALITAISALCVAMRYAVSFWITHPF